MIGTAQRIQDVHQRIDRLLKDHVKLRSAHTSLEEELKGFRRSHSVLQARIAELEKENEVLRSARATAADRSGTKERIDELVSEIDRCLALLTP